MKRVKHILNILLSAYLIVAMGGLIVFNHICSCNKETTISFFVESSCCGAEINALSCNLQGGTCGNNQCEDCACETEVATYSVDETIASSKAKVKLSVQKNPNTAILSFNILLASIEKNETATADQHEKPPAISGKKLVIQYHSLKIPESIS